VKKGQEKKKKERRKRETEERKREGEGGEEERRRGGGVVISPWSLSDLPDGKLSTTSTGTASQPQSVFRWIQRTERTVV